jgi:hypothetical protein
MRVTIRATMFWYVLIALAASTGAGRAVEADWWFSLWPECAKPIAELNVVQLNKCATLREGMANFTAGLDKLRADDEAAHPATARENCYAALPQFREGCDKRIEAEDARKRASGEWRDPPGSTITYGCPPSTHMTERDGCQPKRR